MDRGERVKALLRETLFSDIAEIGGQQLVAKELNKNASTPSRWIDEATMPLIHWVELVVKGGALRSLRLIAALAKCKLVMREEKRTVRDRLQDALIRLVDLLNSPEPEAT